MECASQPRTLRRASAPIEVLTLNTVVHPLSCLSLDMKPVFLRSGLCTCFPASGGIIRRWWYSQGFNKVIECLLIHVDCARSLLTSRTRFILIYDFITGAHDSSVV